MCMGGEGRGGRCVCVWGVRVVAAGVYGMGGEGRGGRCVCVWGVSRGGRCVCVWGVRVVVAGVYVYGGCGALSGWRPVCMCMGGGGGCGSSRDSGVNSPSLAHRP